MLRRMTDLNIGVLLWNMTPDWPTFERAAVRADELGYHHIWTWDHLHAIFGEPQQPVFDGWMSLGGLSRVTRRARLGLLVGANTFRNPGLVAKMATTLDHMSDGRAILGLGGAWFEYEHTAHGIDFGASPGERLRWLDEAASAIRTVLDGGSASSDEAAHYAFSDLRQEPLPIQKRLPIMIGGSGERKTLRTVAKYADMWNMSGPVDKVRHKIQVLDQHCADVGRDPAEIERTISCKLFLRDSEAEARDLVARTMEQNRTPLERVTDDYTFWADTPERTAERLLEYRELGVTTFIPEIPAPYDDETLSRLINEVKPLVERG
jgi:alkanesulfonate monooxygenase SsuD/methylene tetrahydromethanopterin reductase-like flavin-dependent oxidoreductase (luciferase family)